MRRLKRGSKFALEVLKSSGGTLLSAFAQVMYGYESSSIQNSHFHSFSMT